MIQAAVTVIRCISIVVLFVDILIILRRYQAQFEARRLAHPASRPPRARHRQTAGTYSTEG